MTLNITLVTDDAIYQSADFRLTDGDTGRLITDASSKSVGVDGFEWRGFVTYTGIGRWQGKDTSDWLIAWLSGVDDTGDVVADRLRTEGTTWLQQIETATPPPPPYVCDYRLCRSHPDGVGCL